MPLSSTGCSVQVLLRLVSKHNYEEICDLDVHQEQQDYVATNTWSLVEKMFNPSYETRAIYNESVPVGFIMWVPEKPGKASIWRFMIDKNYQNAGIGRRALQLAIDEIKQSGKFKQIEICYHPDNPVAREFYSSFGFQETGMDEDGEDMLAINQL